MTDRRVNIKINDPELNGKFFQVSDDAANRAISGGLTGLGFKVWFYLIQRVDRFGSKKVPCPPPREIAKDLQCSARSVERAFYTLKALRIIDFSIERWEVQNLDAQALRERRALPRVESEEEEKVEVEVEIGEDEEVESESVATQTARQYVGAKGGQLAIASNPRHIALIYAGDETPWLEPPTKTEIRLGQPRWNKAFLEWGAAKYSRLWGKNNKFEAMADFRVNLENNPQNILARWDEYKSTIGQAFQNVADRAASGVEIDDRDRQHLERHRKALENADIQPIARPTSIESADEPRTVSVKAEVVAESPWNPEEQAENIKRMREMMKNRGKIAQPEEPVPERDTPPELTYEWAATLDPIVLNHPETRAKLDRMELQGIVLLEIDANEQVTAVNPGRSAQWAIDLPKSEWNKPEIRPVLDRMAELFLISIEVKKGKIVSVGEGF